MLSGNDIQLVDVVFNTKGNCTYFTTNNKMFLYFLAHCIFLYITFAFFQISDAILTRPSENGEYQLCSPI